MSTVHVGDVGTIFEITVLENNVALDISAATDQKILFRKPDGTVLTKTAAFTTDGTDGKIEYQSQAGDIDVKGTWEIQGRLVLPQGTFYTRATSFRVEEVLA